MEAQRQLCVSNLRVILIVLALLFIVAASASAQVTANPSALTFQAQLPNTNSAPQSVTLTNGGSSSVSLTTPTITGTNSTNFVIRASNCGSALAATHSCLISIYFTPGSQIGTFTATLNTSGGAVALSGIGSNFVVSLATLNLGDMAVGHTVSAALKITTSSSNSLQLTTESITGTNASDFTFPGMKCTSVPAGSSCSLLIAFTPSGLGARNAVLTLGDLYDPTLTIPLQGTGTNLLFSRLNIQFGGQSSGTTSAVQQITVKNVGATALTMSDPTIGPNTPSGTNFAIVSNTCGSALAVGRNCSIGVTFTPHVANLITATLYLHDSDPSGTQPVPLSGYGTQLTFSPPALTFNPIQAGTVAHQTITITNYGTTTVNFGAITLEGSNPTDFAVQNNTCISIATSASCSFGIAFAPTYDSGPLTATVSVTDTAVGGRQLIAVAGSSVRTLSSISPEAVVAGGPSFLLTAQGTGFTSSSTVLWNGSALATTFVSATTLQATVPASAIAMQGAAKILVKTPTASPSVTNTLSLMIATGGDSTFAYSVTNQAANHLVADDAHGVIYLSVPSTAAAHGNTVAVLDPNAGSVTRAVFAGSEPNRLALSSGAQYLYAGIDKGAAVQRFVLPTLAKDIPINLGADSFFGPYYALDVQAAPGFPHTIAVARGAFDVSTEEQGGIVIYDDASPRVTDVGPYPHDDIGTLAWGSDSLTLYGGNNEDTGFDFLTMAVSAAGVTVSHDYRGDFSGFYFRIHFDKGTGYVYADTGQVIDPATGLPAGSYAASTPMVPDSKLNTAFFIGQTSAQNGTNNWTIESFNLTQFTPVNSIVIPNVSGRPKTLIRWGSDGLAFNTDQGQVITVKGTFVGPSSSQPTPTILRENLTYPFPKTLAAHTVK